MPRNKKRSTNKKKLTSKTESSGVLEDNDQSVKVKMVTKAGDTSTTSAGSNESYARFMVQQQNYVAALQYYDKAILENPYNVDLLRKERGSIHAMLYGTLNNDSTTSKDQEASPWLKSGMSYAKRMAQALNQTDGPRVGASKNVEASDEVIAEQELLIQAYSLYYGWGTPKNYAEAFLRFQKATTGSTTKTEASYRLGKMMIRGEGTEKDTEAGLELLRKTALQTEHNPENVFNNQKNVGVSKSCYELGRHFEREAEKNELNSFEDTYQIAAMWYELGSHFQNPSAIRALGLLYSKGKGVPRNEKVAEINFKKACQYAGHTAFLHLADLFIDQMEFKKAKIAIEMGYERKDDRTTEELTKNMKRYSDIDDKIQDIKITRKYVKQFERSYGLVPDGFTFRERLNRMDRITQCSSENKELHGKLFRSDDVDDGEGKVLVSHKLIVNDNKLHEATDLSYHLDDLLIKSICGSTYARLLWDTQTKYCELMTFVDRAYGDWKKITHSFKTAKDFVLLLFNLLKLEYKRISWRESYVKLLYKLLNDISTVNFHQQDCPIFARALAVCLAEIGAMHEAFQPSSFQFLIRAWTLYPREVKLSVTLANYYASVQEFEKAYTVGKEGMESYPDCIDLLFNHAQICLQVTSEKNYEIYPRTEMNKEAIRHLNRFLSLAPREHPKVPEAYYILGKIYHDMYKESENANREFDNIVVKHFLLLGQCAEQNQLTCFIPYESPMKNTLNALLTREEDNSPPPPQGKPKGTQDGISMSRSLEFISQLLRDVKLGAKKLPHEVESLIRQNLCTDETRIKLVNQQRNRFKLELTKSNHQCVNIPRKSGYEDGRKKRLPKILSNLFPLTIDEALVPPQKSWRKRSMCLTVIDETLSGFGLDGVHAIVKDENGNVGKVVFLDVPQDDDVQRNFGFGCKFYILEPHVDMYHGEKVIVAGPHTAFFSSKDDSLCRYCYAPGAKTSCSRCRWANYCDKECQSNDWTILKHKKICYSSPPWNKDLHRPM